MALMRRCFQVDTIWVPSKSASISALKAGTHGPGCCMGLWAVLITYYQVTCTLVCLVFSIKKVHDCLVLTPAQARLARDGKSRVL